MTTFFFCFALFLGWLSYNLYYPIYRYPVFAVTSFLAGWLVGEIAIHHIIWQVGLVSVLVFNGAVTGFAGAVGFIICILAWSGMAYFTLSSHSAKGEMESSLQLALGPGYQANIKKKLRDRFPQSLNYEKIRKPLNIIDRQVEVIKNVPYGNFGQKLDVYRSGENTTNRPVLLQIHGGGWTEKFGDKERQALPLMSHMALRDWICVSIDYRLSPTATFPEHIIDCKQGLVWVKQNILEYGGNPDFIVITGGSAGGQLCALMGLTVNDPLFQPGFEDEDTSIQGAVPFYGVYDFTDSRNLQKHGQQKGWFESSIFKLSRDDHLQEYQQASPLFRVNADAPPFLIIHGDKDSLVPVEEARVFAEELRRISNNPVAYAEISGGQHAFDMFPSVRSEHVKHGVERYLAWLLSQNEVLLPSPAQPGKADEAKPQLT